MKVETSRAVVWLAWGRKFIDEAVESEATISSLGYPTYLITDAESCAYAREKAVFSEVIEADFTSAGSGNQRKSEMWRWLPERHESFLFLDTDTRVLADVSLGFEKAKQYGIAMVPAAHYCLDQFWGFDEVMRKEGVRPRGQLQYNSGVIFFERSPEVKAVFKEWSRLTKEHGGRWDQSFLTLAMEKLNFRPYALSPNYNYRGMGVPIIGEVRIWHTPHEPPDNLNDEPGWWPMRYFVNGRFHRPGFKHNRLKAWTRRMLRRFGLLSYIRKIRTR